jgi:hypothetical protein
MSDRTDRRLSEPVTASANNATPNQGSPLKHPELLVCRKSPTRPFPAPADAFVKSIGILNSAACFAEFLAAGNL